MLHCCGVAVKVRLWPAPAPHSLPFMSPPPLPRPPRTHRLSSESAEALSAAVEREAELRVALAEVSARLEAAGAGEAS